MAASLPIDSLNLSEVKDAQAYNELVVELLKSHIALKNGKTELRSWLVLNSKSEQFEVMTQFHSEIFDDEDKLIDFCIVANNHLKKGFSLRKIPKISHGGEDYKVFVAEQNHNPQFVFYHSPLKQPSLGQQLEQPISFPLESANELQTIIRDGAFGYSPTPLVDSPQSRSMLVSSMDKAVARAKVLPKELELRAKYETVHDAMDGTIKRIEGILKDPDSSREKKSNLLAMLEDNKFFDEEQMSIFREMSRLPSIKHRNPLPKINY
ncbi:hypothetical protein [Parashewanella tropica]|uniref:hypothetical protein n=1 Tax=Parashewanella tropica TaxID=2547970 RepID=UPI00105A2DEA|nr:hypothetical protein [Parashewanella tropica]